MSPGARDPPHTRREHGRCNSGHVTSNVLAGKGRRPAPPPAGGWRVRGAVVFRAPGARRVGVRLRRAHRATTTSFRAPTRTTSRRSARKASTSSSSSISRRWVPSATARPPPRSRARCCRRRQGSRRRSCRGSRSPRSTRWSWGGRTPSTRWP